MSIGRQDFSQLSETGNLFPAHSTALQVSIQFRLLCCRKCLRQIRIE